MANELLIEKQTGGYFKFTLNNDAANAITSIQNDLLAVGNQLHFKTGNGANIIKEQFIYPEDVTLVASGVFTFTTVTQVWNKLIEVGYFAWLSGTSGGVDRFDDLLDTFQYTGNAGKAVVVDGAATKLVPVTFYNKRLFTELEDTPNSLVPDKMVVVNPTGTALIFKDQPLQPEQFLNSVGYFDYNDLATQTTPLNAVANVALKLTNDTEGANTSTDQNPYGVSYVWDYTTNQFKFNELEVGDTIDVRIHIRVTTANANQKVSLKARFGIGSVAQFENVIYSGQFKDSGVQEISFVAPFYMGSTYITDYPAELYLTTDHSATVKIDGWYVRILRKNINIITVDYQVEDASTTTKGIVRLAGDLGGTANSPTVPELANKVPTSRTIGTTSPLLGGGALSSNLSLSIQQANSVNSGYLSNVDWSRFDEAHKDRITSAAVTGTGTKTLTLNQHDGGTVTASWTDNNTGVWGTITGNLPDQIDLKNALDAKVPNSRTITINGVAWNLSTDISYTVGGIWGGITGNLPDQTDLKAALDAKQAALSGTGFVKISGTTISYDNSTYALDSDVVKITTDQNVRGIKTFLGNQTATTLKLIVADYYNDGFITSDNGMLRLLNGTTELFNLASTGDLTAKSFVKTGGTASQFLKANGTVDSTTYLSGTVAIANGGTGATTASAARTNLGATTVGANIFTIPNPNPVTKAYIRANADNTVEWLDGNAFRESIGAGTGNGTVTSVNGTGSYGGLTLTGTVTGSGDLTLGGTPTGTWPISVSGNAASVNTVQVSTNADFYLTFADANNGSPTSEFLYTIGTVKVNPSTGALTASSFVKSGGTSSQFLMADGSVSTGSGGTVTSVAAITLGTTGTDLSSTVANGTTTPVITLNVPTASATNRGALSAADWTTFNSKQNALTNPVTGTGTTNYIPKFTGSSAIGNSLIFDNGTNVGIGTTSPTAFSGYTGLTINNTSGSFTQLQVNGVNSTRFSSESAFTAIFEERNVFMAFGTNNTERMRIFSNGNTFIGASPTDAGYKLDVNGTGRFAGNLTLDNGQLNTPKKIKFDANRNTAGSYGDLEWYNYQWDTLIKASIGTETSGALSNGALVFRTSDGGSNATERMRIAGNGAITATSTITASGGFFNSDIRLKDLTDYDYNVSDIKPITYLWKDGRDNKKHVGYSAQEVQKVMPDAVNEDEKGFLSVNYVEVLVAKIAELENRIKQLEK
jgi:hypothetical protein